MNLKPKKAMPILSFPCVQLMGISVKELVTSSENQARGMALIAEKFDSAAAVSMMDLSVEAECFGAQVRFSENEVPAIIGRLINTADDASTLKIPTVGTKRSGVYIEAVKKAKALITDRPVFAGAIGPFSLAGRLMDMTEIMVNCYIEPEAVKTTLKKATEFIINYISAFKASGADGVIIAEPAAGLLSPELHKEFALPYIKEIIENTKTDNFSVIYHNCGNVVPLANDIFSIGADAYHFGNSIDLSCVLDKTTAPVMGNIDPVSVLKNGTEQLVREKTRALLEKLSAKENFIISSGCDIPPMCNLNNIKAFFDEVKLFYGE